ncbi:MAG: hypothetical protein AAB290_06025 [Candidatus Eisenbacteria bacterium]
MNPSTRHTRWMAGLLLAAIVMATVAPAARADRGRRYKHAGPAHVTRVVTRYHSPGSVYIVRRSSAGPAIAGFLGGLFLGATLAHAAPAGFSYYDPYCDERFVSLEIYRAHLHHHRHPRIVRVIELDTGDYVHTYRYQHGRWDDWDDEDWDED